VQAATRVNYASNLDEIHGLETMVSMAAENCMAVRGGNWRIFDAMLERCNSTCTVLRETGVASIARAKGHSSASPKFVVSTRGAATKAAADDYPIEFDGVVIATPWQFAHINAADGVLPAPIDEIEYRRLHVTLFTTPLQLSGAYFGIPPGGRIPTSVVTTRTPDGADTARFLSISVVSSFPNPHTGVAERAYKIFSRERVTPEFLSNILGVGVPDGFAAPDGPISWYYPHVFHSYPVLNPRATFQDPVLADGLYYTSGIESFISTMETSALMGKNVARLVLDDLARAEKEGGEEEEWVLVEGEDEHGQMVPETEGQKVLDL
jgi:prenylcysteine oxidase/farnesylcysteine lyase